LQEDTFGKESVNQGNALSEVSDQRRSLGEEKSMEIDIGLVEFLLAKETSEEEDLILTKGYSIKELFRKQP